MQNNFLETMPLQAVSAKVHWKIKELLVEAAEKASLTLSEYLSMLINQVLQDKAESAKLQRELELLKQKLAAEEAKNDALKKSDEAKSLRQKEVEVLLERNNQILGMLHQRYGDKPISKELMTKEGFDFNYLTQYVPNGKLLVVRCYNYAYFSNDNQKTFQIVKI